MIVIVDRVRYTRWRMIVIVDLGRHEESRMIVINDRGRYEELLTVMVVERGRATTTENLYMHSLEPRLPNRGPKNDFLQASIFQQKPP